MFQYELWRKEYKKHLTPEEDVDFLGTPGNFKMKETFGIAILIEGNYHPDFKTYFHEQIPNLDQNFDHFNVKNQIFHALSTYFADKLKKLPSTTNHLFPEGTLFTQKLVDPIILKQGHLLADPSDSEMKDLFLLLSNLHDHGAANIELVANEFLESSQKAQVKSLDALFT